jgi:hypothetical protein
MRKTSSFPALLFCAILAAGVVSAAFVAAFISIIAPSPTGSDTRAITTSFNAEKTLIKDRPLATRLHAFEVATAADKNRRGHPLS